MTRSDRGAVVDRVLLATLVPLWLGLLAVLAYHQTFGDPRYIPASVDSARSLDDFPTVRVAFGTDLLRAGDRLMRAGDVELRGWTRIPTYLYGGIGVDDEGRARLEVERRGERLSLRVPTEPRDDWWISVPFTASLVLCSALLLLRADWHLRRRFFLASVGFAVVFSTGETGMGRWDLATASLRAVLTPLAMGLTLWNAFEWKEPRQLPVWARAVSIGIPGALFALGLLGGWLPVPFSGGWTVVALNLATLAFVAVLIAAITAQHRSASALERRRARWALLGFYVSLVPMVVFIAVQLVPTPVAPAVFFTTRAAAILGLAALPAGILVSAVWYDFLDVDRVLSATVSFGTLVVLAALTGLLGIPPLADIVAGLTGIEPANASVALSFVLAASLVPTHRALRPRVDRTLFPQQVAIERSIGALVEGLEGCGGLGEMAECSGKHLEEAFQPESITVYALDGDTFTALFATEHARTFEFTAGGALAGVLREHRAPLLLGEAGAGNLLAPFDRAALETVSAAVIVPVGRGDVLNSFLCLGPKRSGDIYTPTEAALLTAVAASLSQRLLRLDADALLAEARGLQESLERYVPAPLARNLAEGREIASGQRDVTVLFVDIRGYSGLVERSPLEEVHAVLNAYSERISSITREEGGVVVEFGGDGLMIVFGAVTDAPRKARAAVVSALAIREAVETLRLGDQPIEVGIGIASGPAFVGEVQAGDRRFWSAVGSTTNLAARLQALTRDLDAAVAVDAATRSGAEGLCAGFVEHPAVEIRGQRLRRSVFALPRGSS